MFCLTKLTLFCNVQTDLKPKWIRTEEKKCFFFCILIICKSVIRCIPIYKYNVVYVFHVLVQVYLDYHVLFMQYF